MIISEKTVPKLRFKEFRGAWHEILLYDTFKDILDFRGRTPLKLGMEWGGNIPSLSALNVKMGYIDFTLDPHTGSEELYKKWMNKGDLEKGDILFTMEAPLGNVALVPDSKKYILSQRVMALKTKANYDNQFIYQLMRSDKFQNTIENLSTGSTAKGINQRSLQKVKSVFPEKPEQEKIAEFLGGVDDKLASIQSGVTAMHKYKQGVMQALFSGKLRFKDENGNPYPDWQEKRLDDLGIFKSGVGFSEAEQGGKKGTPFFKVSDMNIKGNEKNMLTANHYVSDGQIIKNRYNVIDKNSIIFAKVGAAIFLERKRKAKNFLIDNNMMAFIPNSELNFEFICFAIDRIKFSRMAQVGALPSYNGSDLATIKIVLPSSTDEQEKIADFLKSLDDKIKIEEEKLNQAKNFKKSLLQRMFV